MGTISGILKPSKNFLSYQTHDDSFIKSYVEANEKFKKGDYIYSELSTISCVIKVSSVVNYYHGLAFRYDYMVNRLDKLYKDKWCYSEYCRLATEDEIKLLKKKIKNHRNVKEI